MPKILLTYDLSTPPGKHSEVKAKMKSKGYLDTWYDPSTPSKHYPLPNTCLLGNTTHAQAIADLKEAVRQAGARLEMVIAADFNEFMAEQVNPRG